MFYAHYDFRLVALSIVIAIAAAFTALDLASRVNQASGRVRLCWLVGGSTVMGIGIWSMHYVGMLALSLPVPIQYDIGTVFASALCAIFSSSIALHLVSQSHLRTAKLLAGGTVMGLGVASMHYVGMAAMQLSADCGYNGKLVALSIVIAIVASVAALKLAFALRDQAKQPISMRFAASILMGLAIASMHYTGMAAMTYHHAPEAALSERAFSVSPLGMAILVVATFFLLAVTLVATLLDRQFSEKNHQIGQSEARYRELFEQNPLPAWIYDTEKNSIVEVNEAAVRHYGWSREEFAQQNPHSMSVTSDAYNSSGTSGSRVLCQHRTREGQSMWVEVVEQDISNAQTSCRLFMVHDVTSQIEAEQELKLNREELKRLVLERTAELRMSEERWKRLVEVSPQFVWITDPTGAAIFLNKKFLDFTGLSHDEAAGLGWLGAIHPDDQERALRAWGHSTRTLESYNIEYRLQSTAGEFRWFKARGVPIFDENDRVTQWFGVCADIDDNKQVEERLEQAVAERTSELEQARQTAEEHARSKSQFLAAMSHEIRTPMNGLIGMAGLLSDTLLNSEQREYLEIIRSSSDALLSLVNDVLDLSKMEAGKLELERIEFDLQTVVEEAIDLVKPVAGTKGLSVLFDINVKSLDLIGDPGRLRQILLNLLSNAVKFTNQGSITIAVHESANHGDLQTLRFAVKDTGIGITSDHQKNLFKEYTQADRAIARQAGGTGLGLWIVKLLVEMMGGTIGVFSKPGEGTTFWFNVSFRINQQLRPSNLAGKCVGCVRTLPGIQRRYLEQAGLSIRILDEAELAGRRSPASRVDLVLVDGGYLVGTGSEDLANHLNLSKQPLLILGNAHDLEETHSCERLVKDAWFVAKPVRRRPLLQAIESALATDLSKDLLPAPPVTDMRWAGTRILVAEDNRVNQALARLLLSKLGCQVRIVETGREACIAVEQSDYDLVLMDCNMPEMDGFEATRAIRLANDGKRRLPVVALTAAVMSDEREECYRAGMDDFIPKPYSKKDLERVLQTWLPAAVKS